MRPIVKGNRDNIVIRSDTGNRPKPAALRSAHGHSQGFRGESERFS
jgi:hypothetical protein